MGILFIISPSGREGTRKIKSQYAGGILLQPVQKLAATSISAPRGRNVNESLPVYQIKERIASDILSFILPSGDRYECSDSLHIYDSVL